MEIVPTATYNISGEAIIEMTNALAKRMIDFARKEVSQDKWLTQEEAMTMLNIGPTNKAKMKAIRETGKIKFKKLGAKYSYSYNSLEKFMNA